MTGGATAGSDKLAIIKGAQSAEIPEDRNCVFGGIVLCIYKSTEEINISLYTLGVPEFEARAVKSPYMYICLRLKADSCIGRHVYGRTSGTTEPQA